MDITIIDTRNRVEAQGEIAYVHKVEGNIIIKLVESYPNNGQLFLQLTHEEATKLKEQLDLVLSS